MTDSLKLLIRNAQDHRLLIMAKIRMCHMLFSISTMNSKLLHFSSSILLNMYLFAYIPGLAGGYITDYHLSKVSDENVFVYIIYIITLDVIYIGFYWHSTSDKG